MTPAVTARGLTPTHVSSTAFERIEAGKGLLREGALIYEAEAGDLDLVAVGDAMVTQKLSVYREPRYLELMDLIRGADAAFANLEMTFHDWEPAPGLSTSVAFSATTPATSVKRKSRPL